MNKELKKWQANKVPTRLSNRLPTSGYLFSAPEPKAQVHYCDHALSVVRPSSVRPSSLTFHIFDFSSETAEQNLTKTWQEARSQRPLQSLCFSGRSEKQDGRPGLWLAETFSTSPLKPLDGIRWNLTGSKISTSSTKFVFFMPIGKTRWPPWPLIGGDIFDISSETAERNSTKHDRKQDLNVFYQVCVFRGDRKNKMAALASDWLRHFLLLLWNRWTEFNKTWQEERSQCPLPCLCFSGRSEKTRWPPWLLIGWYIFDNFSETAERNLMKLDRKQDLNVLYKVCVFRGRLENQDTRPGLWLAETFLTSPLKPLNGIWRNLTGSKISTSSTKFMFFVPIGKTRWMPWTIRQKGGTLYSGARYVALWASCLVTSDDKVRLRIETKLSRGNPYLETYMIKFEYFEKYWFYLRFYHLW